MELSSLNVNINKDEGDVEILLARITAGRPEIGSLVTIS
jgi:hypothetical protein